MWSNIIFVVATLCVVNASVIKVYDEREEPVVDEAAEDCDWRACDQLCRNMGFPSGVCIRGRCKCDNFKTAKEELQSPAEPEEPVALRSCNLMECDQRCRRLKFPGGVCVNGRCKCDNFRSVQDFASLIKSYSSPRSCNPQECNQRCRRLKFPGGVCVNGRCKCDNFRSANGLLMSAFEQPNEDVGITNDETEQSNLISDEDESFADFASLIESYSSPRSCNPQECNQRCQRLKFPGGVCVNGRCKCDNFRSADAFIALPVAEPEEEIDTTNDEVEESNLILDQDENLEGEEYSSPRSCNPQECDQRCRRLKFLGGVCVNGRCKCDNFRSADAESDLEESAQPRWGNCDYLDCQRQCFKIGYYGTCVTGRCECMKPYAMSTVLNVEDRAGPQTCDFAKCQQSCNAIGYRARCVGKRCECISRAAANTEFNLEEPAAPQTCDFTRCYQSCSAIGYRARCVGKRCECISRAAASAEFNLEEPAAPQTCNFARCQQSCSAIGYRARCVGKRCECISRAAANTEFSLEEPTSPQSCNFIQCNQQCNRIGFRGQCLNGRCQCVGRAAANTETDAAYSGSDIEEYARLRNCKPELCSLICRFLRYKNGTCVNGRCQCNNDEDSQNNTTQKPVQERNEESTSEDVLTNEIEDSSQVLNEKVAEMIADDDTTTNEVEESNQMPNTEEEGEDLHHRLTRNTCYKNACNSLCKATTGFTGYCNNKNKCTCRKYI